MIKEKVVDILKKLKVKEYTYNTWLHTLLFAKKRREKNLKSIRVHGEKQKKTKGMYTLYIIYEPYNANTYN